MEAGGKSILNTDVEYLSNDIIPLPSFTTGSEPEFLSPNIKSSTSIAELRQLGFVIASQKPDEKWVKGQRSMYVLMRIDDASNPLPNMPKDTRFEYDRANERLRLIGKYVGYLGRSDWLTLKMVYPKREQEYHTFYEIMSHKEKVMKRYRRDSLGMDEKDKIIIKDLPIGVTDSNEILCLKRPESIAEEVEPRIIILGSPRVGKSVFAHGLLGRGMAYWGVKACALNDSQSETGDWCYPDDSQGMSFGLPYNLSKLSELPLGMPTLYLTPNTDDTMSIMHEKDSLGFKISIPFDVLVSNPHWFMDLKGSEKYFMPLKDKLLECKTPTDVIDMFASGQYGPVPPKQSINMVSSLMFDLSRKKIIDRWCGVPARWKVYIQNQFIGSFNPILAGIVAGLCPVLETGDLLNKGYFPSYFTYFARDLFEAQRTNPYFIDHNIKVWAFLDEVTDIARAGTTNMASVILEQLLRKGAMRRIGMVIATQFYDQVPPIIRNNCNYVICFNTGETSDEIVHHLGLAKTEANHLKDLVKFEFGQ